MPFYSEVGKWDPRFDAQIAPQHAHLLPNGKVLYHDWGNNVRLWDPATEVFETPPAPPYHIFCSGHSILEDGRLFVAGGHVGIYHGLDDACTYNPFGNPPTIPWWIQVADMNNFRWYPTCTTLSTGEVLVNSGTTIDQSTFNEVPEAWQPSPPPGGSWRTLTQQRLPLYPWL